ncbi:MAG: hypothetical protein MI919_16815, partial [Holophagales bacterium]|nr:hypothetical protein [Holophagales bacterium]
AAEALLEDEIALAERAYPTSETGYYTQEPLYGDLVRAALELGYQIVAYESPGPPAEREPAQARNLAERIFSDPDARALIHLGYSHNLESPDAFRGVGAMAWHLENLTGIDPLTIDQTRMRERSHPSQEDPLYRLLVDTHGFEEPVVLITDDGKLWHRAEDSRDITVFLPRTRYESGRPGWLRLGGQRRPLALPENVCGEVSPCVVEARLAHEGDDAIPIDRIEVSSEREQPVLMVPDRPLRIQALDAEWNVIRAWEHSPGLVRHDPLSGSGR